MPTVLGPLKSSQGPLPSSELSHFGHVLLLQSLECVFYPGSVRKQDGEGYCTGKKSLLQQRGPWPWLFLARSLPSKIAQEILCLPINSCSAHKQSENMSNCHELDTYALLCVS